jgi:hypothetical protein
MIQHCKTDLPEVVLAVRATRRFPRCLNRREQQCDQHADNGDNHKQFYQRETM